MAGVYVEVATSPVAWTWARRFENGVALSTMNVAVPDAPHAVLAAARTVLDRRGGHGAVRDLADRILAVRAGAAHLVIAQEAP